MQDGEPNFQSNSYKQLDVDGGSVVDGRGQNELARSKVRFSNRPLTAIGPQFEYVAQNSIAASCQSEPVSGAYRSNGDCRLVVTHGRREVALSVCRPKAERRRFNVYVG